MNNDNEKKWRKREWGINKENKKNKKWREREKSLKGLSEK